ncbi:phage tail protein [Pseudomonas sp. SK]|nr:phage tail protein [Pseudomonas sp. SK]
MVDQTSQFYAILTNVGAAKQANADALGIAWKITQMGVGDANGSDPTPNATQISLINEWRRAPLNQLKVDDKNSAIIIAEQVIPADVGGKWIREIALYDADGDMVAVANCAPTYKPLLSQGSGRTQVVRMNLVVSSASNVQLKIDPAVVLATREWVTEELARQDFKHSVLAATTANIALTGLQTVDGVALTTGARVLVKNQTAAKDNGLYLVAGGAWTRCSDADSGAKVTPGMLVLVERGMVNGDSAWQLVTDAPITLGVTALAYEMAFGRTGVASGTYRSVTVDTYGRVIAATNPTTVAGYGLTDVYTKTQIDQSLALKAPLASPVLTGVPTAPTPAAGTNTTQLATAAFVQAAIASLVASSPAALDTLNELAAALGNDPNFATTMTNALALKAPLASPTFTGAPKAQTPAISDNGTSLATTAFVRALMARYGLGTTAYFFAGNIDQIKETGIYSTYASTTGTLPKNPTTGADIIGGMVLHVERDGTNSAFQLWESISSGVAAPGGGVMGLSFRRSRLGSGTWTDWVMAWDALNTPKQANAIDDTAGAMLTVGAFGLGAATADTPLITDFSLDLRPGFYRAFTSGSPQASIGCPPDTGNTSMSVLVGGGYITSGYKTFLAILNAYAATRVFVGVKVTAGEQPMWTEITQVSQLPFRGVQSYKTAGVSTWTVPAGVRKVWVTVTGAGGGGGCSDPATNLGSAGGGGGGISQRLVDLTGVTSVSVTVGAGGAGATAISTAGGSGGTSSFGAYLSATGGVGGGGNSTVGNAPGNSGRGNGGDYNSALGVGAPNYGMNGGSGGGPGPRATQSAVAGNMALDSGGGGSGAYPGQPGGSGAAGCVIIQW